MVVARSRSRESLQREVDVVCMVQDEMLERARLFRPVLDITTNQLDPLRVTCFKVYNEYFNKLQKNLESHYSFKNDEPITYFIASSQKRRTLDILTTLKFKALIITIFYKYILKGFKALHV